MNFKSKTSPVKQRIYQAVYSLWRELCILAISALIIVSRKPGALLRAQFFAEDGIFWFAQAYNQGIFRTFFIPIAGYFQTLARIGGALAQLVPIQYAPLVFVVLSLLVQLLPVAFVLSKRVKPFLANNGICYLWIISYLLLFNTQETYLNLTNAQWYLAIVAFFVLVGTETSTSWWQKFDFGVLLLSGLSGPFAIFFYPLAVLFFLYRRSQQSFWKLSLISVTATIQLCSVVLTGRGGHTFSGSFSLAALGEIFSKQVIWGLLSGQVGYDWLTQRFPAGRFIVTFVVMISLLLIFYSLIRSHLELKLLILLSVMVFLFSVILPTVTVPAGSSSWQVLSNAYGIRYWLLPIVGFLTVLVSATERTRPQLVQITAGFLLGILVFFWLKEYRHKAVYRFNPSENLEYSKQVSDFLQQPIGTDFVIHYPPKPWSMHLIKK